MGQKMHHPPCPHMRAQGVFVQGTEVVWVVFFSLHHITVQEAKAKTQPQSGFFGGSGWCTISGQVQG